MASTRIGKQVEKTLDLFAREPPEVRARVLAAFQAAGAAIGERSISKDTRDALISSVVLILAEGYMGSGWTKVHSALREAAPELYETWIKHLLPEAHARNPLAI